MSTKLSRKKSVYLFLSIVLVLAGCQSIKGIFSKGQDDLKKANAEWTNNNYLQALVYGTQSLITDPEFYQGKVFIKDRFDFAINDAEKKLNAIGTNPAKSEQAEELFFIYNHYVAIYSNLKQIKLPLEGSKKKWVWKTDIIDYTADKEKARSLAYDLLMREGREFVRTNDVANAEIRFKNAVNNYIFDTNERSSISRIIAGELCEAGAREMRTQNIEQAINSYAFYKSALNFVKDYSNALSGSKQAAEYVAKLYLKQGREIEQSNDIEKVITAVDSYKNALKWDAQSAEAQLALKQVVERISEFYYQAGLKAEKAKANTEAIAMFEKVRTWIPDYKDSMSRIYTIRIGGKIEELAKNTTATRTQFNKFRTRVNSVSGVVDKSDDVMNKVTYISDKSRSINQTMKSTSTTLRAFSIIPVVGTTTGILAKSIDIAQDPIGVVANKFDNIEKPVITPTKEVVGKTKSIVDVVKNNLTTTDNSLKTAADYSLKLKDCISKITVETNFKEAEKAIDELNKGLVNSNKTMVKMDGNLIKVENEGKKIAGIANNVSKVTNGFESVNKAVSKVKPTIDKLNGVLDQDFGFSKLGISYKLSARDILNKVSGIMGWVMDKLSGMLMSALKPVLNEFDIKIPSVPGLDQLKADLDKLKGNYDVLNGQINDIKTSATEFVDYQKVISTNLTKLQKAVGCELAKTN